jgi:hypothetical protein
MDPWRFSLLRGSLLVVFLLWGWVGANAYDLYADKRMDIHVSARALGQGALSSAQVGSSAVFGNPAFLGTLQFMELGITGATFSDQSRLGSVVYGQPLPGIGEFGVGYSVLQPNSLIATTDDTLDTFRIQEQDMSFAFSTKILSTLDAGVRFKTLRLEQALGSDSANGIDAGLRFAIPGFWAGLTGYNLLQPIVDVDSNNVGYPKRALFAVGSRWPEVVKAAFEYGQTFGNDSANRIAFGLESDFSANLFLRAGVDSHAIYAGLGYADPGLSIDYGMRNDSSSNTMQHRLSVSLRFGTYQVWLTGSNQYLTKGGVTPQVDVHVSFDREIILKEWNFTIRNSMGAVVKYFNGKNLLPRIITWEGRDTRAKMVADDTYTCSLEGQDLEGNWLRSNSITIMVVSRKAPEFIQVK